MSLLWNANGDQAQTPTIAVPTTARTMVAVIRPTNDTARQQILDFNNEGMAWYAHAAGDEFGGYAGGTTYGDVNAAAANFSTYVLNDWHILFATIVEGVTPTLHLGNISTGASPVEPSSYGFRATLASPLGGSAVCTIGNASSDNTRWWRDRIARAAIYPRALTSDERLNMAAGRLLGGAIIDVWFGWDGVSVEAIDYSGNRHTITLTSLSSPDANPHGVVASPWVSGVHPEDRGLDRGLAD